jgi:choline dehydrogenase-like flavoprotein
VSPDHGGSFAVCLTHSRFDWNYTTTPQVNYNNRAIPYPRGYVLGGCSSTSQSPFINDVTALMPPIDYMVYNRGTQDDWNYYAAATQDQGWSCAVHYKRIATMGTNETWPGGIP